MDLSPAALAFIALASVAAGLINAIAGGGTLLAFPALTVTGVPPVEANIVTTVALTPGYFGGSVAQRDDLRGQRARVVRLAPAGMVGGAIGASLLAVTSESLFRVLVPWLLIAACVLLAMQDRIRAVVDARLTRDGRELHPSGVPIGAVAVVFVAGIYGGYFGGALGIVLLAVLGVTIDDHIRRLNAIKQLLSLLINGAASVVLVASGRLLWLPTIVMAIGSLAGGAMGGRVATRLDPRIFRTVVITIGLIVAAVYLIKS